MLFDLVRVILHIKQAKIGECLGPKLLTQSNLPGIPGLPQLVAK